MKCLHALSFAALLGLALPLAAYSQESPVRQYFPTGTIIHPNINYAGDTFQKHLLDIYLPANAGPSTPLVVWVHGGGWMVNDKYADMSYMRKTIAGILDSGYALASIDYRFSTTAIFPAQIQDCNLALEWLYKNAATYKLNKNRIALMGFSAGGHLASLQALSLNNKVNTFYANGTKPSFGISCVVDFYGPSDLIAIGTTPAALDDKNALTLLLGARAIDRPDLARVASPATYVDKNDPPFLIIQGEKDDQVPNTQAVILNSWLKLHGVPTELIMVAGAPHYGVMFDADDIRAKIFSFLAKHLK
ncbi:alpha/beta hydrolase [Paraflavitalea pollutisoli]|uniref:alpha/beta hydrolase n=1 Tax=Paraflavitalea pollutisoli TaxID=3034143 RepID=UPI0023ECA44C|nr:alpha/beta hydrolase [Paraflavitalea sp. H1-2-19X]